MPHTRSVLAFLALACLPAAAGAAIFDIADGDYVSLRQATRDAAANDEPDTILLAPGGNYRPAGTLTLDTVRGGLKIYGRGATIDGTDADPGRLFDVSDQGNLVIADLVVTGVDYAVTEPFYSGGVLDNRGSTKVRNVTITATSIDATNNSIFGVVLGNSGSLDLKNVTLSGNQASGEIFGLTLNNGGNMTLNNTTIAGNRTANGSSGSLVAIDTSGGNALVMSNTILADNDGDNCSGSIDSSGGNIADDATCSLEDPSDQPNTDPGLGPLADNGGPIPTMAPAAGGAAVNTGVPNLCTPMDARGMPRPQVGVKGAGNRCDPGAMERSNTPFGFQPAVTGSWFDPAQNGHGFTLELLPSGAGLVATWFVFNAAGERDWVQAVGSVSGGIARLTALQAEGGAFPPSFEQQNVSFEYWGTLTIVMHGCNSGTAAWMPDRLGYSSGGMPLSRITNVAGLPCE